jgi:hypothetical protein
LGYTCKGPTKAECKGGDCEDVMVVYIYQKHNIPEGTNPWRDPWIYTADQDGNPDNDFHAIRRDMTKQGTPEWTHVLGWHPKGASESIPRRVRNPEDPDSHWKGNVPEDRYCCRKKKDKK